MENDLISEKVIFCCDPPGSIIGHNIPYFLGNQWNGGPDKALSAPILYQFFHHCISFSDQWDFGPMGFRANGISNQWDFGIMT